jgi:hypothetical protein
MSKENKLDPQKIIGALEWIGNSITPESVSPSDDATGVHVTSLTEGVMGVTAALVQIAEALNNVAEAIREQKE